MQTKIAQILLGLFFVILGGIFLFSQKNIYVLVVNLFGVLTVLQGILCIWIGIKNYQNSIIKFAFFFSVTAVLLSLVIPFVLVGVWQEAGVELGIYIYGLVPLAFLVTFVGVLLPKTNQ